MARVAVRYRRKKEDRARKLSETEQNGSQRRKHIAFLCPDGHYAVIRKVIAVHSFF